MSVDGLDSHVVVIPAYVRALLVVAQPSEYHRKFTDAARRIDFSQTKPDIGMLSDCY